MSNSDNIISPDQTDNPQEGKTQAPNRTSDHILSLVKASVSAVPLIGGPLASLIADYIPTHTSRSIERALQMLSERLKMIEDRVDVASVDKDELAELFKSVALTITRTHQEEKLKAAIGIVTNVLLNEGDEEKLQYTQLDLFARCIDALSIGAIRVLGQTFEICTKDVKGSILNRSFNHNFGLLQERISDMEPSLLMGCIAELNSFNLVHMPGAPTIREKDYRNYNVELTELGVSFVYHLLRWEEQ